MFPNCLDPGAVLALHCPMCPLLTRNMMHFLTHCHVNHTERLEIALYQCSFCLVKCTHWEFLVEHIFADHPGNENVGIVEVSQLSINSSRIMAPTSIRGQTPHLSGQYPPYRHQTNHNHNHRSQQRPLEPHNEIQLPSTTATVSERSTLSLDTMGACSRVFPAIRSGLVVSHSSEEPVVQSLPSASKNRMQPITVQIDKTTISMAHHRQHMEHPRMSIASNNGHTMSQRHHLPTSAVTCGAAVSPLIEHHSSESDTETNNRHHQRPIHSVVDLDHHDSGIGSPLNQHNQLPLPTRSTEAPEIVEVVVSSSEPREAAIKDESVIEWTTDSCEITSQIGGAVREPKLAPSSKQLDASFPPHQTTSFTTEAPISVSSHLPVLTRSASSCTTATNSGRRVMQLDFSGQTSSSQNINNHGNTAEDMYKRLLSDRAINLELDHSSSGSPQRAISIDQDGFHCLVCHRIFTEVIDLEEHEKIAHLNSDLESTPASLTTQAVNLLREYQLRDPPRSVQEQVVTPATDSVVMTATNTAATIASSSSQSLQLRCNQCSKSFANAKALFCHRHFNHATSKKKKRRRPVGFGGSKRKSATAQLADPVETPVVSNVVVPSMTSRATRRKAMTEANAALDQIKGSNAVSSFTTDNNDATMPAMASSPSREAHDSSTIVQSPFRPPTKQARTQSKTVGARTSERSTAPGHRSDEQSQCPFCGVMFINKFAVSVHIGRRHKSDASLSAAPQVPTSSSDPLVISKVNRRILASKKKGAFLAAANLQGSTMTHQEPQSCLHCGTQLENLARLIAHHSNVHRLRPSRCPDCDEVFSAAAPSLLIEHIRLRHPNRPLPPASASPPHALPETIVNSGMEGGVGDRGSNPETPKLRYSVRPIQCLICQKVFGKKPSLKAHMEEFHSELLAYRKRARRSQEDHLGSSSAPIEVLDDVVAV